MVGWYDPGQLWKTALQVLVSTLFGRYSDYRLIEALTTVDAKDVHPYSDRPEIWIDYASDCGDGWDSTYAVAYWLSQPHLAFSHDGSPSVDTRPGDILVLGGDQVYPTASREEYERRLRLPFQTARGYTSAPHPHLFVIPGNHDWYDGLVSFTRLFCAERWFGGWQTRQRRSYFALALPHGWWLLGADASWDRTSTCCRSSSSAASERK
jgi:hypothetical protein